jgi:hypothetical protein
MLLCWPSPESGLPSYYVLMDKCLVGWHAFAVTTSSHFGLLFSNGFCLVCYFAMVSVVVYGFICGP